MQLNYKFLIGIERELTNGSAHSLRSDRNALCAEIQPVKVGRKIYRDCAPNKTAELDTALPQVKQSIKLLLVSMSPNVILKMQNIFSWEKQ